MIGAISGDVIGSVHEGAPAKNKDFPLLVRGSTFTDDTVLTVAVASAILNGADYEFAVRPLWLRLFRHALQRRGGFDVTCQGTVPAAAVAFLESTDFEDAVRNAISFGGDADTLACIAGAMAEAHYGKVPTAIQAEVFRRLDGPLQTAVMAFALAFSTAVARLAYSKAHRWFNATHSAVFAIAGTKLLLSRSAA